MVITRRAPVLIVVAALLWGGCEGQTPSVVLEIDSPAGFADLRVTAKRYLDDGEVELYAPIPLPAEPGTERLRVLLELPVKGRYALHFVDVDPWGTHAVTRCYEVQDTVVDREVSLSFLGAELDADGDTFPDDADRYCAARAEAGLGCDQLCASPDFLALADCDPLPEHVPPEGCAEVPPDAAWNPFARDLCGDCHDVDCYGGDPSCDGLDADGDGYVEGTDCDDSDARVHPGAEELCGNGVDENCTVDIEGCVDGDLPCDGDADGYLARMSPTCGDDCDDANPSAYPGARELCDPPGLDEDCDGEVDEICLPDDVDGDGVPAELDCNDCDPGVGPAATDRCGDGVDGDCEGGDLACDPADADQDGHAEAPAGVDCNDGDPHTYPGAPEHCGDGIAQDCVLDVSCTSIVDMDADGFSPDFDCDDEDASVSPWGSEVCDPLGVDEDCDGVVNEVLDGTGERGCGFDASGGEWFVIDHLTDIRHCGGCRQDCEATSAGTTCQNGLCNCDGIGPCEGGLTGTCCPEEGSEDPHCADLTRDAANCGACNHRCRLGESCQAAGVDEPGRCICPAEGAPCPSGDCWRCCPAVGCVNVCEDVDHCGSCDHDCDSGDAPIGNECEDGECRCGPEPACSSPEWCTIVTEPAGDRCGCADLTGDIDNCGSCGRRCNDSEPCTEDSCVDSACVYATLDGDDDGYCEAGCNDNHTGERGDCTNGDCDDSDPAIHPGATERCSTATVDEDCDGDFNDPGASGCSDFMIDADRDGFGDGAVTRCLCDPEAPYDALVSGDCNDGDEFMNPAADDMCNGINDDCSGSTDDGDDECLGYCCGSPPACQICCDDTHCLATETCSLTTFTCVLL